MTTTTNSNGVRASVIRYTEHSGDRIEKGYLVYADRPLWRLRLDSGPGSVWSLVRESDGMHIHRRFDVDPLEWIDLLVSLHDRDLNRA